MSTGRRRQDPVSGAGVLHCSHGAVLLRWISATRCSHPRQARWLPGLKRGRGFGRRPSSLEDLLAESSRRPLLGPLRGHPLRCVRVSRRTKPGILPSPSGLDVVGCVARRSLPARSGAIRPGSALWVRCRQGCGARRRVDAPRSTRPHRPQTSQASHSPSPPPPPTSASAVSCVNRQLASGSSPGTNAKDPPQMLGCARRVCETRTNRSGSRPGSSEKSTQRGGA